MLLPTVSRALNIGCPSAAVVVVALVACRPSDRPKTDDASKDAGAPETSASAPIDATAPPRVAPTFAPPSTEAPPSLGDAKDAAGPGKVKTYKTDLGEITLEGVYFPPEEGDGNVCPEPLRLDVPIRVVNDRTGANADPSARGGVTTRVCLHSWKEPAFWQGASMLQRNSHVKVRGEVSGPFARLHPSAIIVMDVVLVGASPPTTPAPAGSLPEGASLVYARKVDVATRTFAFDLAYLYYGEDAQRIATSRGQTLPANQLWFVVNDSTQLRTITLDPKLSPMELSHENGGGWRQLDLENVASEAEESLTPRDGGAESSGPFFVHVKKGKVVEDKYGFAGLRRVSFSR